MDIGLIMILVAVIGSNIYNQVLEHRTEKMQNELKQIKQKLNHIEAQSYEDRTKRYH